LGRPVDQVVDELRAKGLRVTTEPVDNPGGKDADTVAGVSPTTGLHEGDTLTLQFYREAETTSAPPSSEPTSAPPSDTSTPSTPASPSVSSQASQTATATTSVSAAGRQAPSPAA